jgi:hypothetical protein
MYRTFDSGTYAYTGSRSDWGGFDETQIRIALVVLLL